MGEYDRIVGEQMALERMSSVDLALLERCFEAGYDFGRWDIRHDSLARLLPVPVPEDCVRSRANGLALGLIDRSVAASPSR